jgi:hypothetical protein
MKQGVLIDPGGLVGLAIAAHIRRNNAVSCFRKCFELMSPRIPRLWPSMTKQNQGTFARHSEMHIDTVGLNKPMGDFQI